MAKSRVVYLALGVDSVHSVDVECSACRVLPSNRQRERTGSESQELREWLCDVVGNTGA